MADWYLDQSGGNGEDLLEYGSGSLLSPIQHNTNTSN